MAQRQRARAERGDVRWGFGAASHRREEVEAPAAPVHLEGGGRYERESGDGEHAAMTYVETKAPTYEPYRRAFSRSPGIGKGERPRAGPCMARCTIPNIEPGFQKR